MYIAIVEDAKSDADSLIDMIHSYGEENGLSFELRHFADGIEFLNAYKSVYDIVFMDIQMPYKDGMSVAQKLREIDENVPLVFVTNMQQYAIKGYEVSAIDFIVKPVLKEIFDIKFRKILSVAERARNVEIIIPTKSKTIKINIKDIDYVEVINHKSIYHLGEREIESWATLSKIFETLSTHRFAYCNSCYLVNLDMVEAIEGDMLILRHAKLKISRAKRKEFLRALAMSIGRG